MMQRIKNWFHTKDGEVQQELNKQLVVIVSSIIVTVISVIGVTYSAFVWNDNSDKNQSIVAGDVVMDISAASSALGSNLNYPIEEELESSLDPYSFTITNSGTLPSYYSLKIVDETEDNNGNKYTNNLEKEYIYINLSGGTTIERTSLKNYDNKPIGTGVLNPGESKTFDLRLWIINTAPNSVIGQQWHGKIQLETRQTIEMALADEILTNSSSLLVKDGGVHYFTGSNPNNHLIITDGELIRYYENSVQTSITTDELECLILGVDSNGSVIIIPKNLYSMNLPGDSTEKTEVYIHNSLKTTTTDNFTLYPYVLNKSGWTVEDYSNSYICNNTDINNSDNTTLNICQKEYCTDDGCSVGAYQNFVYTLKGNLEVTGTGTSNDPYVIK